MIPLNGTTGALSLNLYAGQMDRFKRSSQLSLFTRKREKRLVFLSFLFYRDLMRIAHLAKQWCKDDLSVLKPISNFLLEKLTADSPMDPKEVPFLDQTGQNYRVASVDVGATPCSMHIPLNQFLSMLLTCFNHRHEMADECLALGYLQSPGDLLEIVDPVLTVLTVLAQIKCGMWRRNGMYGEGQHYVYNEPK